MVQVKYRKILTRCKLRSSHVKSVDKAKQFIYHTSFVWVKIASKTEEKVLCICVVKKTLSCLVLSQEFQPFYNRGPFSKFCMAHFLKFCLNWS